MIPPIEKFLTLHSLGHTYISDGLSLFGQTKKEIFQKNPSWRRGEGYLGS